MPILSELIESDVENSQDVLNSILSSSSAAPTPQVSKKTAPARKQQKSHKAAKPNAAPKSRPAKAAPAPKRATAKKATAAKRKAAEEHLDEVEHGSNAGDLPETEPPKSRGGSSTAAKARPRAAAPQKDPGDDIMHVEPSPAAAATAHPAASRPAKTAPNVSSAGSAPRPAKRVKTSAQMPLQKTHLDAKTGAHAHAHAVTSEPEETPMLETEETRLLEPEETPMLQTEETRLLESEETRLSESEETPLLEPQEMPPLEPEVMPRLQPARPQPVRPRKASQQNPRVRQQPVVRRRAASASDTERGDPGLRRKLGDITRKFDNVELKYRNLKEVGISEANANMEKLRQRCEASTLASNQLIASLKKELAAQAPLARDAQKIKAQIQAQEAEMAKLRTTATELAGSLAAAQNEIKALQAKLAAARASSVAAEGRTPARESKKETRPALVPASEAVQMAQMKEELYSDLTGLIVRSVKRSAAGDTYDCIQTGRNGTLHFKLFIDAEDAKNTSFEETDFLYTPLLDANRDRDMIELMPTYLTEEITFARQNAAKFYGRVLDTLTKRKANE
ncbi:hypothetical protein DV737_g3088, partial [Chaetothyriales sp. CBS 132003]